MPQIALKIVLIEIKRVCQQSEGPPRRALVGSVIQKPEADRGGNAPDARAFGQPSGLPQGVEVVKGNRVVFRPSVPNGSQQGSLLR
jgi:hypothetical protein